MTVTAYFWLKSKICIRKVPVKTINKLMWSISFISICALDINSITIQQLYLTKLIYTNDRLREFVISICYPHGKQI